MHVSMRRLLVAMLCLSLTLLVGCGQRSLPVEKTYPAQGKVTIKGEPARFVIVNFEPVDQTDSWWHSVLAGGRDRPRSRAVPRGEAGATRA